MKMPKSNRRTLWDVVGARLEQASPTLWGLDAKVALRDLIDGSSLDAPVETLAGRSVVIKTEDQLTAALALIELDGTARRLVLCPPDLTAEHVLSVVAAAEADILVTDRPDADTDIPAIERRVLCRPKLTAARDERGSRWETEWILLTSGTTGAPKLVSHTLSSLTGVIKPGADLGEPPVWSTFYDIRRYGGLQILLRALFGGASMVFSNACETPAEFLVRAGERGVTHISGTPSHWRRALMSPLANRIAPHYVRLSGEIADQTILDRLHAAYPAAGISHAFAATEAGVGFAVDDGLAGFPARFVDECLGDVEMKIQDESLWIRSPLTASRYLGPEHRLTIDADGFMDTGDLVERRGDRYYFIGRKGGIINVGGQKVHPEEVEAVINRHPSVRMSLVRARKSPFTGAVVVAEVVLTDGPDGQSDVLKSELMSACHAALAAHKVPASIRFVSALDIGTSGKLARRNG
jgi:acyl-CoA synthetase (AMP-forming)/AMP-acid ligase II